MTDNKNNTNNHLLVEVGIGETKTNVKKVNHGNVFNTGSWFTFYCGKCGCQVVNRSIKCEGTNPFVKGCGTELNWEIN